MGQATTEGITTSEETDVIPVHFSGSRRVRCASVALGEHSRAVRVLPTERNQQARLKAKYDMLEEEVDETKMVRPSIQPNSEP